MMSGYQRPAGEPAAVREEEMKNVLVALLVLAASLPALDWEMTIVPGVQYVDDILLGPGGQLYVAGNTSDSGYVFASSDYFNWNPTGSLGARHVYCLIMTPGDTLFAGTRAAHTSTDSGRLFVSSDAGATWEHRSSLGPGAVGLKLTALLEDDSGYIYGGQDYFDGSRGFPPFRSTDRGFTWSQAGSVSRMSAYDYCIIQDSARTVYCATWGNRGLVLKSVNHGATWTATAELFDAGDTPSLIEVPGGVLYACTYPKVVPQQPYGRVFTSTNSGTSWTEIGQGYFNTTEGLRPLYRTSDGAIFVGADPTAEVFVTADGGTTWTSAGVIPYSTIVYKFLQVAHADTNFLYATTGPNGMVFRAILPITGVTEGSPASTERLGIRVAAGNPFMDEATIEYIAPGANRVELTVFDAAGRPVRTLQSGTQLQGQHVARWDGRDNRNHVVPAGIYFCRLAAGESTVSAKLVKTQD